VLGHLRDDVPALIRRRLGDALDREVVRLGRAAGERDLAGPGAVVGLDAEQGGELVGRGGVTLKTLRVG
jgi:hypothetical protein